MTSYMYNPSKKVTELLSKFLEFDPEELQLGIWSGDLLLTNVNLRGDALYSKINRMKKSPSGRDPLKLKILESRISSLRIQIPWKRLVWGQGDVVIDIKGINFVVGFESREETEARQAEEERSGKTKTKKDEEKDEHVSLYSKKFRDAKQKVLAEAEQRLMKGQHLSTWLAQMKKELEVEMKPSLNGQKKVKGFNKWMEKASSNFVWRFLAGLQLNIEGFKLTILQDNIEVGIIMPNTHIYSGKMGSRTSKNNNVDETPADDKSFSKPPEPEEVEEGENIDKAIDALGVSIFVRRQQVLLHHDAQLHPPVLLPDDYVLRPIDLNCSLSVFYPREEQSRKRKALAGSYLGTSLDAMSMGENSSVSSVKRRRGKREKHPIRPPANSSTDGTAETDVVSSFAPGDLYGGGGGRQRSTMSHQMSDTHLDLERATNKSLPSFRRTSTLGGQATSRSTHLYSGSRPSGISRLMSGGATSASSRHRRQTSNSSFGRSAPLVKPDDLSSVYAYAMAENSQVTPKFDLRLNCGEIKLLVSSQHLDIMHEFFAVGARMRNGRPTATIAEVMSDNKKGHNKRTYGSGASVDDPNSLALVRRREGIAAHRLRNEFPNRRISMARNELAAKARNRRTQVVKSWWHYGYGVVAYEIQKRKRRRDNFRAKYVSFDWERQKNRRREYVNLYLGLELDVGQHVDLDASLEDQDPDVEELLRIEDELPIEQILLYRSIARALAIHEIDSMPTSIEVLYRDYASDLAAEQRRASMTSGDPSRHISKRLSMHEYIQALPSEDEDDDNLLGMIGKRCDRGRKFRSYFKQHNVQLFNDERQYRLVNNKVQQSPANEENERRYRSNTPRQASMGLGTDSGDRESSTRREDLGASKVSFSGLDSYTEDIDATPTPSKTASKRRGDGADGRTVKTFKTSKSARSSAMAGTVFEYENKNNQGDSTATGAKLSFALFFKSVELMLVADEPVEPPVHRASRMSNLSHLSTDTGSSGSSDDVSELSFQSEEDFFREQDTAPIAAIEEEETDDKPMLSSTDFLLFGLPKNMLLHVTLSPMRLTILGRSGGSKNVNFTVGSITASGDGRDNLIAIGSRASPTPVPVVSLTKAGRSGSSHEAGFRYSGGQSGPKEAITFSLVVHKGHKVLQADVSKVHINLDVPLLLRLMRFPSTSDDGNPKRTLPKSEREEARLFILRENPPSKFAGINSSIRIHGVDLSVPVDSPGIAQESESSASTQSGSFDQPENNSPLARVSASIVELYSGTAVEDLCGGAEGGAQVGSLAMLDVAELVTSRGSLSSHHCVVAVSGVDCVLKTETDVFAFSNAPSLVAEPIDIEMLFTTNGSTILDEDSPRQEIVVEVSPVHILLSETRLLFCNRVLTPWKARGDNKQGKNEEDSIPPRLEALSRLIMRCLDVSIRRLKISLMSDEQKYPLTPGQKEIIMEESISDFLSIVSCFDLTFPNEDALSSAMQIAIDRLCGLGLFPDDAWDCANAALLSFFEDEAHAGSSGDEQDDMDATEQSINISEIDASNADDSRADAPKMDTSKKENSKPSKKDKRAIDKAIRNAVSKALMEFPPPDDEMDPERQPLNNLLVIDMPGGAQVSTIQLFYDFHLAASLPTLFVTNTAGVRLVRIVPVEHTPQNTGDQGSSVEDFEGEASEPGLVFSRFLLDAEHSFGRGGLPLSVLGSDEGPFEDSIVRIREKLDDLQIGEFEFTFSYRSFKDMIGTINKLKSCMSSPESNEKKADNAKEQSEQSGDMPVKSSFFAKADIVTLLMASDELAPFSRLRMESLYLKRDGRPLDPEQPHIDVLRMVSRNCALLNLTEQGQFYPDAISVLYSEDATAFPFQLDYTMNSPPWQVGSKMEMWFRGYRLFLLRNYINELLQYLLSDMYGIGKLRNEQKVADEIKRGGKEDTTPPLAYKVHILDSSLILPRSTRNHDMACIELPKGLIYNSRHQNSFAMPTPTTPLKPERDLDASEIGKKFFTRMNFQLHQTRIYSSLGKERSTHADEESPIFRYFYDVAGRAQDNGWVYTRLAEDDPPEELVPEFNALCERRWKEITTDVLSLDILVDYAPSLRVLICEPLELKDFVPAPRLDVRMSQFNLLLSIWYANMQELPVMFPYPPTKFINDGRNLLWHTVPAEYGTDDYLKVWDDWSCVKTEICVILRNLAMRTQFDPFEYHTMQPEIKTFYDNPDDQKNAHCVQIFFTDVVVHTYSDLRGMMRVSVGAAGFDLIDERRSKHCQRTFACSKKAGVDKDRFTTFADLSWGLREDSKGLDKPLPQPVQISVYMTKDWSLINLGLDEANGILLELSPIWFFLGFFVSYFQDGAYGHPGYVGNGKAREVKDVLQSARKVEMPDPEGLNIDFRLWLAKPHLCIPCDLVDARAPSLRIESETGLWYRFRSIREYKCQEVISTGLDLLFANEFLAPRERSDTRDSMVRHLVERLSFALRLDSNNDEYHSDYALQIPYDVNSKSNCSLTTHEIQVSPIILEAPTICSPVETPTRRLGPVVCEITILVEVLPLTSSVMVNFFKGPVPDETIQAIPGFQPPIEDETPGTMSFSADIGDLRLFAVDPVLGVQLPIAVVSISSLVFSANQLSAVPINKSQVSRGESPPEDLQVIVNCNLWGDYFKLGVTRSWEPLLEPYSFVLLYEKSKYRGTGMSLNADCPLHVNMSGALLLIIDDVIDSFSRLIKEAFGHDIEHDIERVIPKSSLLRERLIVGEKVRLNASQNLTVLHDIPKPLLEDRVAFSLCNLTGQKMRIHQQEGFVRPDEKLKPAVVTYLNHDEATSLSFDATISVVKNLSVVEVPYPGLRNSQSMKRAKRSTRHAVDVQLPGFRWVQGIKVDTFGRKFESLRPRSHDLVSKILQDWRLENALQLLVEVGLDNGGRLVTVRSLFEVRNNTTHPLSLLLHPDPQHKPEDNKKIKVFSEGEESAGATATDSISIVQPGEFFQIPTYLLESSLHMGGSHLGSMWLKPNSHEDISFPSLVPGIGHEGTGETNFDTVFCSRPVQLAKLVQESSLMYEEYGGDFEIAPEIAKSGIQIACPSKSEAGEPLAPFCYAIEVGRSPIVADKRRSSPYLLGNPEIHGPVAYTLSVHAPFVIANFLPETGRFELMHAVRRTVLWYGDLKPGQQVPVHSVGLDAPLLLLLNLGFCRTPVGEGALVHHGADVSVTKDNALKALVGKSAGAVSKVVNKSTGVVGKAVTKSGKAVTKSKVGKVVKQRTKQIGKSIGVDSPEKRGLDDPNNLELGGELFESNKTQAQYQGTGGVGSMGLDMGMDTPDGKVHSVETNMYSPNDVAAETEVVDSIGQRLNLSIENIRGGGGQRRIAVYCPFWIVNTTQHSLRYKQEGSKAFVSGTVVDGERDGSKPVDGSTRNYVNRHQLARATRMNPDKYLRSHKPMNEGTIFAGTVGALATSPGRCDLSPTDLTDLIDKDLSLERLANLAFMFNFHEDVLSIGNRRLSVQLADATEHVQYFSDWSRGFSLDSVGFSQIVALHCREGRALELSVVVSVAPGFLSGYTKIVRFVPRYVLVNQLEFPVRLWQDSSVFRPLNEDRSTTGIDELVRGTDMGKWRFATMEDEHVSVINSYEALWGRVTLLEETENERIMEGTTAHRNASYITSAGPLEFVPFHLPDSRGERQLRVGMGSTWNLTASFASDFPGDHTLRVTRAVDLRFVRHVSTRASPQYKISLPPVAQDGVQEWDGELGIWFETDWGGDKRIIVKGMKRGRYCFNETDIHAGDELLRIDNVSVSRMSFSETMKLLKQRIAQITASGNKMKMSDQSTIFNRSSAFLRRRMPDLSEDRSEPHHDRLVLTFRTLEERLRRLRLKAARNSGMNHQGRGGLNQPGGGDSVSQQGDAAAFNRSAGGLRVEMKPLHHSMFVVLRRQNPANPPFRIENRSMNHTIFYRQRGCEAHPWNHLKPGQTQAYSWEEPMRPKRLAVRAARDGLFLTRTDSESPEDNSVRSYSSDGGGSREIEHRAARSSKLRQILSYQYVEDEEQGRFGAMTIVKLEEIGYRGFLACPLTGEEGEGRRGGHLNVEVETDGATRILVVSDDTYRDDEVAVMNRRLETLKRQVREEESRLANLAALRFLMERATNGTTDANDESILEAQAKSSLPLYEQQLTGLDVSEKTRAIEDLAKNITDDFPEDTSIHRRHQVVVEVLEAVGLNPENEIGSCNPYCEVLLKGRSKLRKSFFEKRRDRGKTYYQRKSLAPKWTDQLFVFDVPPEAVHVTRGHSIHVRVRNFRYVGAHQLLGQAVVHLHSVRDQQELIGWYPLAGRTGSTELDNPLSHWGRGSVKLRIHWVHTTPSLLDYFIMFTEKRLLQLQERKHGLRDQWQQAADAEKRRKEGDLLRSTSTPNVPKVHKDRQSARKLTNLSQRGDFDNSATGEDDSSSRGGVSGLQKIAQDRKRFFQKFQKLAKQKEGRGNGEGDEHGVVYDSEQWTASQSGLPKITEHADTSDGSSSSGSDTSMFDMTSDSDDEQKSGKDRPNKRGSLKAFQLGNVSLSNVKAFRRPTTRRGRQSEVGDPTRALARSTGKLFAQKLFKRLSQAATTKDKMQDSSSLGEQDDEDGMKRFTNSDTVKELREQQLLFHDIGQYYHRVDPYLFHGKADDGKALDLPLIRSWTTAQAFMNDETLDLKIVDDKSFNVVIHESVKSQRMQHDSGGSYAKKIAKEKISLPPTAPLSMGQRALQHVEYLVQSRNQFERACRRALRSVLNPGGWLTIRPITALNLPDTYTGMHVKLKYGPEVVVSSTVDAKVTPTWTPKDVMSRVNTIPDLYEDEEAFYEEGHEDVPAALNMDRFEFYENDLLFYVEPQKTSGSIRLSVVGERLNNKSELGVLHIPLGAAIGSCIDCIEDYLDSFSESAPAATPMYVRWFPLMNPKDTDPVEGDMGLSSRPPESEKLGDDQFIQYFAPCIQLALMWWPDDRDVGYDMDEEVSDVQGSQSLRPANSEEENQRALTNNYFNADIGRISAALIDSERAKELLSFSALDIDLRYSETDAKTRIGLVIGWVQLDHQEDKSREPVVLAPKPVEHIQPTCQLLVVKDNLRSKKNIMSYEHIRLTLEEMDLTIEEAWLFDLWDFFIGVVRRREVRKKQTGAEESKADELLTTMSRFVDVEAPDPDSPPLLSMLVGEHSEEDASAGKVYVEQLVLGLLKVNLSYVKGKNKSWELTDKGDWVTKNLVDPGGLQSNQSQNFSPEEGENSELFTRWSQHTYDEDLWAERQGKRSQNLKGIIGAVLPNVSDAPIRLQGKVLDNVFESPSEILSSISKFYVMETLRQVYKIIGSLDFVGNPTMLFSSFVSGVRDLVVTPSVAFLRSPTNPSLVGIGVAKGTLSLFSHSTSGIFGFLAKTTAAAGQAAAILTLDREYRDWHRERVVIEATNLNREWKKRGVKSVSAMVAKPVGDIVLGALMGVGGLFTAPYKGYRDGGKLGLTQGIAIGGIGLVVKPIVGLLDAFAHFTASIHDIAKSVNILERRYQPVLKLRLPYTFGMSSVLAPFDSVASRSVYLLKSFVPKNPRAKSQSLAWKETHLASEVLHMEPGVDTYSIVTTMRVVLMKVKKDNNGKLMPEMCWEVLLSKDDKVKSQVSDHGHNGVALTITRRYKPSVKRFQRRKLSASTETPTQQATPNTDPAQTNENAEQDDNLKTPVASPGDDVASGGEEEAEVDGEAPAEEGEADDAASNRAQSSRWEPADKENAYHGHGATRGDAGEMLEWFTVLAEYNNRPQLTRIHNAISCILNNFDAVVQDKHRNPELGQEGFTSFGLFDFEKNFADDTQNGSTERFIMSALERLPWMHDSTFEATRGKSREEQRTIVRDIREKWVFSRELEASIKLGGPAWLVEARAHALFVPSESPLPPPSIPRNDPIIKQILYQQDHGNISREQVRKLFEVHLDDLQGNDSRHSVWRKTSTESTSDDFDSFAKLEEYQSAFSEVSTTVVHPRSSMYSSDLSEFKGQDLDVFQSAYEQMPTTLVRPGSGMSTDYDDAEEYDSESVLSMRTGTTMGSETALDKLASAEKPSPASGDGAIARHLARHQNNKSPTSSPLKSQTKRGANVSALTASNNPGDADDRIGRIEGLMEQLVIFNSQLALMKGPALLQGDGASLLPQQPQAGSQDNGVLHREIHALRYQLQQQATKDEATNEILSDLKDELANIRSELTGNEDEPTKKPPEKKKSKGKKQKKANKKEQVEEQAVLPIDDEKARRKKRSSLRWFMGSSKSNRNKRKGGENDVGSSALLTLSGPLTKEEHEVTAVASEEANEAATPGAAQSPKNTPETKTST